MALLVAGIGNGPQAGSATAIATRKCILLIDLTAYSVNFGRYLIWPNHICTIKQPAKPRSWNKSCCINPSESYIISAQIVFAPACSSVKLAWTTFGFKTLVSCMSSLISL